MCFSQQHGGRTLIRMRGRPAKMISKKIVCGEGLLARVLLFRDSMAPENPDLSLHQQKKGSLRAQEWLRRDAGVAP